MGRASSLKQTVYPWVRDCEIDLGHLPVTVTQTSPSNFRYAMITWAIVVPVFCLILYEFVVDARGIAVLMAVISIACAFLFIADFRHRTINFSPDWVVIKDRSWRGRKNFSVPYTEFKGVLRIVRLGAGTYFMNAIVLNHADRRKSITLFQTNTLLMFVPHTVAKPAPRDKWKEYARTLNLPAQEETPEGIITYVLDDLGKSVKELARKGKLAVQFDHSLPPPKRLAVESMRDGDKEVRAVRIKGSLIGPRAARVEVAAGELAIREGAKKERHLPFGDIESVQILCFIPGGALATKYFNLLTISTATEEIALGHGLSVEALKWLRDYILTAMIDG